MATGLLWILLLFAVSPHCVFSHDGIMNHDTIVRKNAGQNNPFVTAQRCDLFERPDHGMVQPSKQVLEKNTPSPA
jgi:hypothetical protein